MPDNSRVHALLSHVGLGGYAELLAANKIELDVLPDLTDADLKELGIPLGDRKRLLKAFRTLAAIPAAAGFGAAPGSSSSPPQAERRQLTVMFVDLVGSTALSGRLDPEEMHEVLRLYRDVVTDVVARFEGYVAKFMGDGVLAYFGWPKAHEEEAERAVRTGLTIVEAVAQLTVPDGARLAARVGIASGLVVVGDLVGKGAAQEEGAVGDTLNLAARLQALAEPGSVVVGPSVRRLAGAAFAFVDLGEQRLKGFDQPVRAARVLSRAPAASRFEARRLSGLTPLVGRDEELAFLTERWASAGMGKGRVVLLSGEPGIGKSRLVQALLDRLAGESFELLCYQCSSYFADTPLHPIAERLERAAGLQHGDLPEAKLAKLEALLAGRVKDAARVMPLLADLLSIPNDGRYPPLPPSPQQRREALLRALVDSVAGLAVDRPVLVDFEDAHWLDATSLDFLSRLVERVSTERILLLITFRPEFTPPWPDDGHVATLVLRRLSQDQAWAVAGHVAADQTLPAEVTARIVERADGVPLFIEELTKAVVGSRLPQDGSGHGAPSGLSSRVAIPDTLRDSLMARLDRLAPVREVAQAAAIIGREFSYDLLAAVVLMPEGELRTALDQLVDADLVFERGNASQPGYAFKHALIRDAAYTSLLRARRRQLHAAIADALECRFPATAEAQPELVAHHYGAAGLAEQAIARWDKAARRAIERSGSVEAVAHLRRALDLLAGLPASRERDRRELGLRSTLGAQLAVTKGYSAPDVGAAFGRARALCQELGDAPELPPVLFGLWRYYLARARYPTSREMAEQCLALGEEIGNASLILKANHALSWTSMALGQLGRAREHIEVTLRLYQPECHSPLAFVYGTDPGPHSRALLSWQLWLLGWPDQALAAGERALAEARAHNHKVTLGVCQFYAALLHELRREPARVREVGAEGMAICREQGVGFYLALLTIMRSWALAQQGDVDAIPSLRKGLASFLRTGALVLTPYLRAKLADAYRVAGRPDEALRVIDRALAAAERSQERWFEADLHRCRGELLLAGDEADRSGAEACFRRALDVARRTGARSFELRATMSLVRLWGQGGKRAEARDLLAPIYGWFTEGFATPDLTEAKQLLETLV
jgi:class 3 adenylate cyclase/predicted ATPase